MNIVDTSVVIKWLFREEYSDKALGLLENEKEFTAPEYIRIEVFSNITKKIRAGFLQTFDSKTILKQFEQLTLYLLPYSDLQYLAFEIATEYPINFYDSIFLAAAINRKVNFYTFDFRLKRSVENTVFDEIVRIPT